uniref:Uncharacterized protein n=1 Tax=Chromera velia CCMP2878 TaxID=1169474 RepID=A0A0G4IEI5_9ALVE|eukprot:Cvel_13625.t1-p1 / transcript=Cvel_13625.t1 / gene=Cvel_13625 / organism=Chromera_velia_CCMP2878 / gene_product=hypothetical protein / transcript_product=hypothetical protein / location=Cvel_scaffold938:58444-59549(+) / protein_length=297 / sequence_SO=supercontig / SO=protein_coding / is_pseudo=false
MLIKLRRCLPLYHDVLRRMQQTDFKTQGLIVNEEAQAALGHFYLCCAFNLRRVEVDAVGDDGDALLRLALRVAKEAVEPWLESARAFVNSPKGSEGADAGQEPGGVKKKNPVMMNLYGEAVTQRGERGEGGRQSEVDQETDSSSSGEETETEEEGGMERRQRAVRDPRGFFVWRLWGSDEREAAQAVAEELGEGHHSERFAGFASSVDSLKNGGEGGHSVTEQEYDVEDLLDMIMTDSHLQFPLDLLRAELSRLSDDRVRSVVKSELSDAGLLVTAEELMAAAAMEVSTSDSSSEFK